MWTNGKQLAKTTLELIAFGTLFTAAMLVMIYLPAIRLPFQQGEILLLPSVVIFFALRLPYPVGRWWLKLSYEFTALVILNGYILMEFSIVMNIPLLESGSTLVVILFLVGMASAAFITIRLFIRFWGFWNRLRKKNLAWALTHAHMVVALAGLIILAILFVLVLSNMLPGRTTLAQILVAIPITLVVFSPSVFVLAIILGVSAVFSYIVMRPTVRRLSDLVKVTDLLHDGVYGVRIPIQGQDEVSRLQSNFNSMAAQLEQSMTDLRDERDSVIKLLQLRRDLVTSISHELRTPVATLRAYLESMNTQEIPSGLHHDFGIVSDEVIHLQALIDDLFTLARTESGQLPLRHEPADVSALVKRLVEVMAPLAWNSYRIQLSAIADGEPVLANTDALRLEQILRNLLRNSLQHTPPGGIITIEVIPRGDQVQIVVEDTGEGIAPADLPHIWERFYHGKTTAGIEGTGLGLALVKQLTEAMHGCVQVESTLGEGSRFTITLPRSLDS